MIVDQTKLFVPAYQAVSKTKNFKPALFGGFITSQTDDASPINILGITDNKKEYTPQEKAVALVGQEACYWSALNKRLLENDFNTAQPFQMFLVPLVAVETHPLILTSMDKISPYHISLGKNLDFYEHIFHGKIATSTRSNPETISSAELGVTNGEVIYKSRQLLTQLYENEFTYILKTLMKENTDFQTAIRENKLEELILNINVREGLATYWINNIGVSWDVFYFLDSMIDNALRESIRADGASDEFVKAVMLHSQYLGDLYKTVQETAIAQNTYRYPVCTAAQFILQA